MEFSDLSREKLGFILAAAMLTEACSVTAPFIDRRREAGAATLQTLYVGASQPDAPAVCYNALTTPYAEVKKLADEECRKQRTGSYAVAEKQTVFTCRLLIPNHFYFKCAGPIPEKAN